MLVFDFQTSLGDFKCVWHIIYEMNITTSHMQFINCIEFLHVRSKYNAWQIKAVIKSQITVYHCKIYNYKLIQCIFKVVWQGSYQEPISVNDRIVAMESMKYEIKQKHSGDWSLTISNLKSSDQARYTCMKGATEVQVVDLWIKGIKLIYRRYLSLYYK